MVTDETVAVLRQNSKENGKGAKLAVDILSDRVTGSQAAPGLRICEIVCGLQIRGRLARVHGVSSLHQKTYGGRGALYPPANWRGL